VEFAREQGVQAEAGELAVDGGSVAGAAVAGAARTGLSRVVFCAAVLIVQGAWLAVLGYLAFRFL
jgi:hypothetical protein